MSTKQEIAATIRAGAQVLRERGWAQGAFELPTGERCAAGALMDARTDDETYINVRNVLDAHLPSEFGGLTDWNDEPGRTVEDVLDLFERAAVAVERDD